MGRIKHILLAAMASVPFAFAAAADASPFLPGGERTTQPIGHYELCQRMAVECEQTTPKRAPVELTRALWAKIVEINNAVNVSVKPMTDMQIWGVEERWSYPDQGVGDCEDYALEKRRRLMKLGIPAGNLLITVLRQPNGDGHAVLTVRTSLGDFILDNLEPRVLAWHETPYQFLKRQSERNSGVWISIGDDRNMLVGSVRR